MVSVLAADRRCSCMVRLYGQVVDVATSRRLVWSRCLRQIVGVAVRSGCMVRS